MLHFGRFREQGYVISSSVFWVGTMHGLMHVKVTTFIDMSSVSFMRLRYDTNINYKGSLIFGSPYNIPTLTKSKMHFSSTSRISRQYVKTNTTVLPVKSESDVVFC